MLAAVGALAALVIVTAHALGAAGELTPRGCISDLTDPAGCGATQQGLGGAGGVAVTADGRSVYAASVADNAIVRFSRDPASGGLTGAGCIADAGDAAGCGVTEQGLSSAFGVAATLDGRSVYVASEADSAIVRFNRDPTTGALSGQGCIEDPDDPAGCAGSAQGLRNARGVAAAPDGSSVYVASSEGAIVRFDRDTSGALAPIGCFSDAGDAAGCGATQQGLGGAQGVAVSPDGRSVYVASFGDSAIARFDRDPATLALTPAGCVSDAGDPAGCGTIQQGLGGARGVAVSPDGRSVYVGSQTDDAIVRFDRDQTSGALTAAGCVSDVGDPAGCGATQQGLNGAFGVAVAPDGRSVYGAATLDAAIGLLRRNRTTGALTPAACVSDVGDPAGCGATQQGLNGARTTAVSPDGRSVYVAAGADAAIARFDRDNAPTLTLSAKRRQTSPKQVVVTASCDVDCTVDAAGTIKVPTLEQSAGKRATATAKPKKFKLRGASATLEAGETAKLTLKNKARARKRLKRALKAGKLGRAKIVATAADGIGDTAAPEKIKVKVQKKA